MQPAGSEQANMYSLGTESVIRVGVYFGYRQIPRASRHRVTHQYLKLHPIGCPVRRDVSLSMSMPESVTEGEVTDC